ncbi:MAG: MBL fold metallo-hydrolase RNA specificity domain-containing protein [Actinomycetota bacterium]
MSEVSIAFLGAAGTVTGSRFLLTCGETKVMVDAGLFQGIKALRERNWEPLEVDASSLSAVVITHAHLDHCGYIPRLVKDGFKGKIYLTEYTGKLAEVILLDSARIQVEDAKYAQKKGFSKHEPPLPLYDEDDASKAITKFHSVNFRERVEIAQETSITFQPAGHILGAASVEIDFFGKRFLFSGDLGRPDHPLLVAPDPIPAGHFDAIITESTYGDREHLDAESNLAQIITSTIARGGSVLIPAFAVDRTEVLLVELRELIEGGEIPSVPVYADSPMALRALEYYREAIRGNSPEIRQEVLGQKLISDPFDAGNLVELKSVEESMSINKPTEPCIIISASGMATGGRVVHHLAHMLAIPSHTIVLVGYQAMGTRGRFLLEGAEYVKMHGKEIPVKAQIEQINSFSVHADASEILDWLATATEPPARLFIVHGEEDSSESLRQRAKAQLGWNCLVPKDNQIFNLD